MKLSKKSLLKIEFKYSLVIRKTKAMFKNALLSNLVDFYMLH